MREVAQSFCPLVKYLFTEILSSENFGQGLKKCCCEGIQIKFICCKQTSYMHIMFINEKNPNNRFKIVPEASRL